MRHGNYSTIMPFCTTFLIPILPMRHGNCIEQFLHISAISFRSYLWGMETVNWWGCKNDQWEFRSYLWGMETKMPNVNWEKVLFHSDPTYEAWKPKSVAHLGMASVIPILPMRHGNPASPYPREYRLSFRSYLWGMETWPRIFFSFDFAPIPILPMRHGNAKEIILQYLNTHIPILPMRHGNSSANIDFRVESVFRSYLWGMETLQLPHLQLLYLYSDPTYEAWKLTKLLNFSVLSIYSDPTYEAWKQHILYNFELASHNSDPTYEAWKLMIKQYTKKGGKNSDPTYEAWKQIISEEWRRE